ncbi:MAG TPA: 4-alpha-glucanotransferase, partial [Kofleriaceae bacterium]|nr:4-alpha-glucanotransferase [Kofleriaceae bacterium]
DIGRGSPATRAAGRLFAFVRALGFTGVQLGPQGQTSRSNPSPYDGTIFSRHIGNIAVATLRTLTGDAAVERVLVAGGPARHRHAYDAMHELVGLAYEQLDGREDLRTRVAAFRVANSAWLESDAAFAAAHDGAPVEHYIFGQFLAHEEHERVRRTCGMLLYGDMQIGYSQADAWRFADAFLPGYLMGAPPSRTNPDGQPWGYPVLDPAQYGGAAAALVVARAEKAFAEYDSIRIDHPHGLVCPWVYRSDSGPHSTAVREGARLFESPDLEDHRRLAAFAIARPEQIDRTKPRYHDGWVTDLDQEQVGRYALLMDAILDAAHRAGRSRDDISCEVLSTMPAPLGAVLRRHGLGRWRVTQKANMDDPNDVYRSESAQREDWVMLGNHDTAPILSVIRGWAPAQREKWARHLAARLRLAQPQRLASDGFMATAMLAELFVSRAENVSIFFADLFGYTERFNVPGLVDEANWSLRLPHDFEQLHAQRLAREEALDLPLAVELALAAQEDGAERR